MHPAKISLKGWFVRLLHMSQLQRSHKTGKTKKLASWDLFGLELFSIWVEDLQDVLMQDRKRRNSKGCFMVLRA